MKRTTILACLLTVAAAPAVAGLACSGEEEATTSTGTGGNGGSGGTGTAGQGPGGNLFPDGGCSPGQACGDGGICTDDGECCTTASDGTVCCDVNFDGDFADCRPPDIECTRDDECDDVLD